MKQAMIQLRLLMAFLLCKSIYGQSTSTLITENVFLGLNCSTIPAGSAMYAQNFVNALAALQATAIGGGDAGDGLAGSVTEGTGAGEAFGNYYCRGRGVVSADECAACVVNATSELRGTEMCVTGNSAIVWYGFCTVQVTNLDIRSQLQVEPKVVRQVSPGSVTPDASVAADDLRELHQITISNAINTEQGFSFSSMVPAGQTMRYHVIAQCDPINLTTEDCETCLHRAREEPCVPPQCGAFSSMVLILYPSCQYMFGYE